MYQTLCIDSHSTWTITKDAIYLYPTDSLYGLWCIITPENIERINTIKHRQEWKHYSLIAPSFDWIIEHFDVDQTIKTKRQKRYDLYGPLTLLCKRKDPDFYGYVSSNILIGIRMINHPFQDIITQTGLPFLTTSANISWLPYQEETIQKDFAETVDYYITSTAYRTHKPSTIIDRCTEKILHRQ